MSTYRFTRANVDDTVNLVYDFIVNYIREKGYPPAVRDICAGVGIRSTSTIHGHLKRLQESGRISYSSGKRRATRSGPVRGQTVTCRCRAITAGVPILPKRTSSALSPFPLISCDDGESSP